MHFISSLVDVDRSLTFFISEQTMVNHAAEASQLISSLQYLLCVLCLWQWVRAALSQRSLYIPVINITNGPPSDKQNKCCSIYWLLLGAFWYRVPITCTRSPRSLVHGPAASTQLLLGDCEPRLSGDYVTILTSHGWLCVCAQSALDIPMALLYALFAQVFIE